MGKYSQFIEQNVLDDSGQVALDQPLKFPREAVTRENVDYGQINTFLEQAATRLQHDESWADEGEEDEDIQALTQVALSRLVQVHSPVPSAQPELGFLTPGRETLAREHEAKRLNAVLGKLTEIRQRRAGIKALVARNPDLESELNITSYMTKAKDAAVFAAKKGWSALDIVFRNVDRPRGALAEYTLAKQQGAGPLDASRRARAVLTGTERGWKLVPEVLGPSWKEVMLAAGMDDDLGTKALGFAADVVIDPVNILGIGMSRKGLEIGAHQVLNSAGREMYGRVLRQELDLTVRRFGKASELELPAEEITSAHYRSALRMRAEVNSSTSRARELLDLGGLKIAGHTLPGTAYIRKRKGIREGYEFDNVSEGLARMLGRGSLRGMDVIGRRLKKQDNAWLGRNIGKFMSWLPQTLEEAGHKLGTIVSRTNPSAGDDYKWFKQAEYYDLMGLKVSVTQDTIRQMFDGVRVDDLSELPAVMERGGAAVQEYLTRAGMTHGAHYAMRLGKALADYRAQMDNIIIDEVKRGWLGAEKWPEGRRLLFERWVRSGGQLAVGERLTKSFASVYVDNYIPHFYHNVRKLKKLFPPSSTPRAPSITEPFTRARKVDTLDEAVELGLVPETNLAVLAGIRMNAYHRATVTHDFLTEVASKYGVNLSALSGTGREMIELAGKPLPDPMWRKVMTARVNINGRVPWSIAEQLEAARVMSKEKGVDPQAIAKLDDVAIKEFLGTRLRMVGRKQGKFFWKKYVVKATQRGLYDGYGLAPATTYSQASAKARELFDPFYPQWAQVEAGGLADPKVLSRIFLPTPIVEDLERLRGWQWPEEWSYLLHGYDMANFWWKRNVTILFPAFHIRNKLTNVLNSMLDIGISGVTNRRAMWDIVSGGDGVLDAGVTKYSYSQVRQLARRFGVYRSIYRRHDVVQMMQDVIRGETGKATTLARKFGVSLPGREELLKRGELVSPVNIANPLINPYQAGADVGAAIENSDRIQLFAKSLQRGMSPEQAARRVNQFLFDYDDVSRAEQQVVRRFIFPFWTWTRKNLALQAREALRGSPDVGVNLWLAPSKFARALSVEKDDAMRSDVERELLPRYVTENFGVRTDVAGAVSTWMLNIDVPQADLDMLYQGDAKRTLGAWFSSIGPFTRGVLEAAADQDFYRGRKQLHFPTGTRVYDVLLPFKNTSFGKWLGIEQKVYRDQEIVTVDPDRFRSLMWLTAWQFNRLYTTVGRLSDPKQGSITTRLFNFLTGVRFDHIKPVDELNKLANSATDELRAAYGTMWKEALQREKLRILDAGETDNFIQQLDSAIDTPSQPSELEDGDSWEEEDGV